MFSPVPKLRQMIGPSFVLLGLGLGSGELILWPYLAANYGLGIIWGAVIGITMQFFLNMEIARYTLVTGESIFSGLVKRFGRFTPIWFLFSTIVPWIWPGIGTTSATIISRIFNLPKPEYVAMIFIVLCGLILSFGYKTLERWQKIMIGVGSPIVLILCLLLADGPSMLSLGKGVFGLGDNYFFIPAGITLSTFFAALAYSGAGGNLNLAHSSYIAQRGYKADEGNFKPWWKAINLEHGIVFWFTGLVTMLLLGLLSFVTVYKITGGATGVEFLFVQRASIAGVLGNYVATGFLVLVALLLFSTQLTIYDATSRILSQNWSILTGKKVSQSIFLWLEIAAGLLILLLGFKEPFMLVVLGAVLNAFSMFIYSGMVIWTNSTILSSETRPSKFRRLALIFVFVFFGCFSLATILNYLGIIKF